MLVIVARMKNVREVNFLVPRLERDHSPQNLYSEPTNSDHQRANTST
jgi:hypothetical protein